MGVSQNYGYLFGGSILEGLHYFETILVSPNCGKLPFLPSEEILTEDSSLVQKKRNIRNFIHAHGLD